MTRASAFVMLLSLAALPADARAGTVLYSGTGAGEEGVTLNASALVEISGATLTITLMNTGDSAGAAFDVPGNALTGVFFDLPSGVQLTPQSATVASGSILNAGACISPCTTTTQVGGEFGYRSTSNWGPGGPTGDHGIAASGYVGVSSANFPGANLEGPTNPNGPGFGIVASRSVNPFNPNPKLASVPLIESQVVFTMAITNSAGAPHSNLLVSDISNVSFQYGTGFDQPGFSATPQATAVPEPATWLLLAPALAVMARRRLRPHTRT